MDPVALVALIISLIALVITTGQLLQQYFGTADGYRRCQDSVMSPRWAAMTKLHFRWSEYRFETLYCVPDISIDFIPNHNVKIIRSESTIGDAHSEQTKLNLEDEYMIDGDKPLHSNMQKESKYGGSQGRGEMVCWVPLIDCLHITQGKMKYFYPVMDGVQNAQSQSKGPQMESRRVQTHGSQVNMQAIRDPRKIRDPRDIQVPFFRVRKRSWDFMPPNVVRPLCLSTVSDVASLVLRLGMKWKEFDPSKGIFRADGSGHSLTSRNVMSIGTCLEFAVTSSIEDLFRDSRDTSYRVALDTSYLPVGGVSDLAFGIVPGNISLGSWQRSVGSDRKIFKFLDFLDNTGVQNLNLSKNLKEAMEDKPGWIPGFNDIIPLTAPKLSQKTTFLRNIPMPNVYFPGLLRTKEGLISFTNRLRIYVNEQSDSASPQLKNVLAKIDSLERHEIWKSEDSAWACLRMIGRDVNSAIKLDFPFQNEVHHALDKTKATLVNMRKIKDTFYVTLLTEHIRMAIGVHKDVKKIEDKAKEERETEQTKFGEIRRDGRRWLSISMDKYWNGLSDLKKRVAEDTGCKEQEAGDAWVMMIFRAFCWHHCHRLRRQTLILPEEWQTGSQVYPMLDEEAPVKFLIQFLR